MKAVKIKMIDEEVVAMVDDTGSSNSATSNSSPIQIKLPRVASPQQPLQIQEESPYLMVDYQGREQSHFQENQKKKEALLFNDTPKERGTMVRQMLNNKHEIKGKIDSIVSKQRVVFKESFASFEERISSQSPDIKPNFPRVTEQPYKEGVKSQKNTNFELSLQQILDKKSSTKQDDRNQFLQSEKFVSKKHNAEQNHIVQNQENRAKIGFDFPESSPLMLPAPANQNTKRFPVVKPSRPGNKRVTTTLTMRPYFEAHQVRQQSYNQQQNPHENGPNSGGTGLATKEAFPSINLYSLDEFSRAATHVAENMAKHTRSPKVNKNRLQIPHSILIEKTPGGQTSGLSRSKTAKNLTQYRIQQENASQSSKNSDIGTKTKSRILAPSETTLAKLLQVKKPLDDQFMEFENQSQQNESTHVTYEEKEQNKMSMNVLDQVIMLQFLDTQDIITLINLCQKLSKSERLLKYLKKSHFRHLQTFQHRNRSTNKFYQTLRIKLWFCALRMQQKIENCRLQHIESPNNRSQRPRKTEDLEMSTIQADLERVDFSCFPGSRQGEVKQKLKYILVTLARAIPSGYYQGMHYLVMALLRVTNLHLNLSIELAIRLHRVKALTVALQDVTGNEMDRILGEMTIYFGNYLPNLSAQMTKYGASVDFFAVTWLITMNFRMRDTNLIRKKKSSFEIVSEIDRLLFDFLSLDGQKSLLKVPICALLALEKQEIDQKINKIVFQRNQLSQQTMGVIQEQKPDINNELNLQKQHSGKSYNNRLLLATEESVLETERGGDTEDKCEILIQLIKRRASDYLCGGAAGAKSFSKYGQNRNEQIAIIADMIKKYESVKVSERLLTVFREKESASMGRRKSFQLGTQEQKSIMLSPFGKSNIFADFGEKTLNTFGYGFNMLGNGLKQTFIQIGSNSAQKQKNRKNAIENNDEFEIIETQDFKSMHQTKNRLLTSVSQSQILFDNNSSPTNFSKKITPVDKQTQLIGDDLSQQNSVKSSFVNNNSSTPTVVLEYSQQAKPAKHSQHNQSDQRHRKSYTKILQADSPLKEQINEEIVEKTATAKQKSDIQMPDKSGKNDVECQGKQYSKFNQDDSVDLSEADEGSMIASKIRITQVRGKRTFVEAAKTQTTNSKQIDNQSAFIIEQSLQDFQGRFSDLKMPYVRQEQEEGEEISVKDSSGQKEIIQNDGISDSKRVDLSQTLTHFYTSLVIKPDDKDDSLPFKRAEDFDYKDSPVKGEQSTRISLPSFSIKMPNQSSESVSQSTVFQNGSEILKPITEVNKTQKGGTKRIEIDLKENDLKVDESQSKQREKVLQVTRNRTQSDVHEINRTFKGSGAKANQNSYSIPSFSPNRSTTSKNSEDKNSDSHSGSRLSLCMPSDKQMKKSRFVPKNQVPQQRNKQIIFQKPKEALSTMGSPKISPQLSTKNSPQIRKEESYKNMQDHLKQTTWNQSLLKLAAGKQRDYFEAMPRNSLSISPNGGSSLKSLSNKGASSDKKDRQPLLISRKKSGNKITEYSAMFSQAKQSKNDGFEVAKSPNQKQPLKEQNSAGGMLSQILGSSSKMSQKSKKSHPKPQTQLSSRKSSNHSINVDLSSNNYEDTLSISTIRNQGPTPLLVKSTIYKNTSSSGSRIAQITSSRYSPQQTNKTPQKASPKQKKNSPILFPKTNESFQMQNYGQQIKQQTRLKSPHISPLHKAKISYEQHHSNRYQQNRQYNEEIDQMSAVSTCSMVTKGLEGGGEKDGVSRQDQLTRVQKIPSSTKPDKMMARNSIQMKNKLFDMANNRKQSQ